MHPIIFLAFANDPSSPLDGLTQESKAIKKALEEAEKGGLCEIIERSNTTLEDIMEVFQHKDYRGRIAIFHYGGHANSYQLLLESYEGQNMAVRSEGLVSFFAGQDSLELVFLNGCSSQQQALDMIEAGLPAVIGTSKNIKDDIASLLAGRFYLGLGQGAGIETAWKEAVDELKMRESTANIRDLLWEGNEELPSNGKYHPDRFPWNLYFKEGAEKSKRWNLPEQADNPLFNIPKIPKSYKWPNEPFLFLKRYQKEHAKVFFGRSYAIRDLYNMVTDPNIAPIVLLYGQSGAGKSSLLEAGLYPRLEGSYNIEYIRRSSKNGLLHDLQQALMFESNLKSEQSDKDENSLLDTWHAIEAQTGKPLLIILDQVEDVFTRPLKNKPEELQQFFTALASIFGNTNKAPKGKLVLGYRKEFHPEIEEGFKNNKLPRELLFLQHLRRRDIIKIFKELSELPVYKIKIEESEENKLPEVVADDLLEDKDSSVAPVLQILLTKMWNKANKKKEGDVNFTKDLYQNMKGSGDLLDDFFQQQINALKKINKQAVDSGLVLNILYDHTTKMGSSDAKELTELAERYKHTKVFDCDIEHLIQEMKNLYLLSEPKKGVTTLIHDTIAPLIQNAFKQSEYPGQRALRILENKLRERKTDKDVLLDFPELQVVERGERSMKVLGEEEKELIKKSVEQRTVVIKRRRRINRLGIAAAVFILVFAIFGITQWSSSKKVLAQMAVNNLQNQSKLLMKENPTLAVSMLHLYATAKKEQLGQEEETFTDVQEDDVKGKLNRIKSLMPKDLDKYIDQQHLYRANLQQVRNSEITSAHFSPSEKHLVAVAHNRVIQLWDIEKGAVVTLKRTIKPVLLTATFIADEQILLTYIDGTTELYNIQGDLIEEKASRLEGFSDPYVVMSNLENTHFILGETHGSFGKKEVEEWDKTLYSINTLSNTVKKIRLPNHFQPEPKELEFGNIEYYFPSIYAISPDGKFSVGASMTSDSLVLYDLETGKIKSNLIRQVRRNSTFPPKIKVNFSPNSKQIAFVFSNGGMVWDIAKGKAINLNLKGDSLATPVFSEGNQHLLISGISSPDSSLNNMVGLFELSKDSITIASYLKEQNKATSVGFSKSGRCIFKANNTSGIHVWYMEDAPKKGENNDDVLQVALGTSSLMQEAKHYLKDFDGNFVYSMSDPVFYRKVALYLIIGFLTFMIISSLIDHWDYESDFYYGAASYGYDTRRKVIYAIPIYLPAIAISFLIPTGGNILEDMQALFDAMMLVLAPVLLIMVSIASKHFFEQKKWLWGVAYALIGLGLGFVGLYFPFIDYLNLLSSSDVVVVPIVGMVIIVAVGIICMKAITEYDSTVFRVKAGYWVSVILLWIIFILSLTSFFYF